MTKWTLTGEAGKAFPEEGTSTSYARLHLGLERRGPALALGSGKEKIGYEAGAAFGYRWRWLELSVNAGRTYDPTREAGMDRLFTVGAILQIGPSVPR